MGTLAVETVARDIKRATQSSSIDRVNSIISGETHRYTVHLH